MMKGVFITAFHNELRVLFRQPAELANPLAFFTLVASLFPLALGAQEQFLRESAPGLLWVTALLAVLLSLEGMFRSDLDDGSLEQWMVSPNSLAILTLAKVSANWICTGLSLVVLAPILALMLGLPVYCLPALMLSLLLGTPVLSAVGAVGAALTVGLRRGGLLLALLILPLYIPVLILGCGTVEASLQGLPITAHLLWLACLTVLSITLTPFAIGAGLSISVTE
jgi:heme exporter protein B